MAGSDNQASGFPPVCTGSDLVLILGSFPGRSSLQKKEYYGHRTNGFWPIMGRLLGFDPRISYPERVEQLKLNRVALWDVLISCSRSGSLDSSIERGSMVVNDFEGFFEKNRFIHTILFNGSLAETEFNRKVLKNRPPQSRNMSMYRLPSTSPAMAMLNLAQKTEAWSVLVNLLQDKPENHI